MRIMKSGSESYDPIYLAANPTKHIVYNSNFKKILSNLGTCSTPRSCQTDDVYTEIERETLLYKFCNMVHGTHFVTCHLLDIFAFKRYENEFSSFKNVKLPNCIITLFESI